LRHPRVEGPTIRRGTSKQDYQTDPLFISAIKKRFGRIDFDLAANADNHQADRWFGPGGEAPDAIVEMWRDVDPDPRDSHHHEAGPHRMQNLWLNPPFGEIPRWARKCADWSQWACEDRTAKQLLFLVPCSVGSNWFVESCFQQRALILFLNGRLTFVGETQSYPKDLMLVVYGSFRGIDCWRWKDGMQA
jgi:DNA N-6-adenine-methyltransferase Dam